MERRNFESVLYGGCPLATLKSSALISKGPMEVAADEKNDLVAVMGGEPAQMYAKAIEAMGGISRFVKKGRKL